MSSFTHKNLTDLEDAAAKHGFGDGFASRFGHEDLECSQTGFSLQRLDPGRQLPFAHRHSEAEEVYVVIAGSGRMLLNEDVIDLKRLDAVRVSPGVTRSLEAGDDGLEYLVFGPRVKGDGETTQVQWPS